VLQDGYLFIKSLVVASFAVELIGVIVSHLFQDVDTDDDFQVLASIISQVVVLNSLSSLNLAHLSAVKLFQELSVANSGLALSGSTKFSCRACANQIQFFLA
jgi:hypothetical protein